MSSQPPLASQPGRASLAGLYRRGLLEDTLPFWIRHGVDTQYGGFHFSVDRDGRLVDSDKSVWLQARFIWLLCTLYHSVKPSREWLTLARDGLHFLRTHGFDKDGRMFFQLTREGEPIRKRRYVFSEMFTTMALAAYARAAGDEEARDQATSLFRLVLHYLTTPELLPPKFTQIRPYKALAVPMMLIATAQTLRSVSEDQDLCNLWIDRSIEEISRDFMHPEFAAVLENVGLNGEFHDHFDGRLLTPGHAIEAAWFILAEAEYRGAQELVRLGTKILDWMWDWGWDTAQGGLFYFRDVKGYPVQEYWADMKFWWPHTEAIIATLLAYQQTGNPKYAEWHQQVHSWAYAHFPDTQYGEWFGYAHRDGSLASSAKGNLWKGAFHVPRMQLTCWRALEGGRLLG